MKKLSSSFKNMLLSLTLIAMASGISLSFVNELTIGPILEARKQKKINAIKLVLPEVSNDPFNEKLSIALPDKKDSIDIFPGKMNDEFNGLAIASYTEKGYNGIIRLMVGFDMEGNIMNIAVLEQKETPGLGTKIVNESFLRQYRGKNPGTWNMTVKNDGGETDIISGATITCRAFNDAVQTAYDVFVNEKEQLEKQ